MIELKRISLWDQGGSTKNIGPGTLDIRSKYARIRVPRDNFDRAGCKYRPVGYDVLASDGATVVYEGFVSHTVVKGSSKGPVIVLKCKPAEEYND